VHLLHVFPSFQVGGSQRRFAALANHFAAGGAPFRHTVVSLDGCADALSLLAPDVPCATVEAPRKSNSVAAIFHARRLLHEIGPDLLITYNWGAVDWAAASGTVRHIHIEDGFGPEEAHRQLRRRVLFRRFVLNRNATVVLPSRTLVRLALEQWRITPERVIYLPNGIPCARFNSPADPAIQAGFRGEGSVIGTVAGLRREKALDRLIDAFAIVRRVRPARLVIVGDGPERAALERHARSSGAADSITFTGPLARPEQAITSFDMFAISSDTEQMPLSVLEAMAAGLAIAATDAGDIAAMIAEENRRFVAPCTAPALAAALLGLLDDEVLRRRIGAANRARAVTTFDETRMFNAYERLFLGEDEPQAAPRTLRAAAPL
jgi:glycosyltransferase involved in cell wall biosynthesis